jgi:hypothetical protein
LVFVFQVTGGVVNDLNLKGKISGAGARKIFSPEKLDMPRFFIRLCASFKGRDAIIEYRQRGGALLGSEHKNNKNTARRASPVSIGRLIRKTITNARFARAFLSRRREAKKWRPRRVAKVGAALQEKRWAARLEARRGPRASDHTLIH